MNLLPALAVAGVAVLLAGAVVITLHLLAANRNVVPAVFTPAGAMDEVLQALDLPVRGRLYDLGCGDGRVLRAALARRQQLVVTGIDNNPVVLTLAKVRLWGRAKLVGGDIMRLDLSDADRVFAYLGPGLMAGLEPKFERELPKGARVVSQQFPLPNRKPDIVVDLAAGKPYANRLYVYSY